jgi:hypothetical protein
MITGNTFNTVKQFAIKYGKGIVQNPAVPEKEVVEYSSAAMHEASLGFLVALESGDLEQIAMMGAGMIHDIMVIFLQFGLPFEDCFAAVHDARMHMQRAQGDPKSNPTIAPPGWKGPEEAIHSAIFRAAGLGRMSTKKRPTEPVLEPQEPAPMIKIDDIRPPATTVETKARKERKLKAMTPPTPAQAAAVIQGETADILPPAPKAAPTKAPVSVPPDLMEGPRDTGVLDRLERELKGGE